MILAGRVMGWFVYMIEASDGSLYTGVTTQGQKTGENSLPTRPSRPQQRPEKGGGNQEINT